MKLSESQFMELSTTTKTITMNEYVKFVSYVYEGKISIQLHIGNRNLKKQIFFFKGVTYKDFNLWTYDSIEGYKTTIRQMLDRIDEVGVIS